jgi:hypothetical protein
VPNDEPVSTPGIDGVDVFGRSYDWPPERENGGQCMDCGFLSRRSVDPARPGVEEVSVDDRGGGQLFRLTNGVPSIPWCFVRPTAEVDILRETEAAAAEARRQAREQGTPDFVRVSLPQVDVMTPLMRDRRCPEWIWHTQFLSPAEHRQERASARQETARLNLLTAVKDLNERSLEFAHMSGRLNTRWQALFMVFAAVAAIVAVIGLTATLWPNETRQGLDNVVQFLRLR